MQDSEPITLGSIYDPFGLVPVNPCSICGESTNYVISLWVHKSLAHNLNSKKTPGAAID